MWIVGRARASSLLVAVSSATVAVALLLAPSSSHRQFRRDRTATVLAASTTLFDFSRPETAERFERIDDAVMGGISTSSLKPPSTPDVDHATWSGVCREDGGGFCGARTRPFVAPVPVPSSATGLFLDCRLVSDDEPERRVWKMTARVDDTRGEVVHQARFEPPSGEAFGRVSIPFSDFRLVRGPRLVPDGPPLTFENSGLYQIGVTVSRFAQGTVNETVTLDNFRPGYFRLDVRRLGVYDDDDEDDDELSLPDTLGEAEVAKRRPLLLKVLSPVFRLLFSERRNRRRSAAKLLRERRGLSRWGVLAYGFRSRRGATNLGEAAARTAGLVAADATRFAIGIVLRVVVVTPLVALRRASRAWTKRKEKASSSPETVETAPSP